MISGNDLEKNVFSVSPYTNNSNPKGNKSALLRASPYNSKISDIKATTQSRRNQYGNE